MIDIGRAGIPVRPPAAFNLVRISQGQPPRAATADPLLTAVLPGLLAIAALLLIALTWWTVRMIRRRPAKRASTRRTIAGTIGTLAACTALIAGTAWLLPATLGGNLALAMLWAPDIAHAIIVVVVLAATLAVVRIARTIRLIHTRRQVDSPAPADSYNLKVVQVEE
jgi:hypothetical protein